MRRAVEDISALPPAELMDYAVVSVALTTALWDAVARRALLERAAAAARDAGALQVLDTTLWIMSLAELKGGTPRAAGGTSRRCVSSAGPSVRRRAGGQRRLPRVERRTARAGPGHLGCRAGDGVRRRPLLGRGRPRRAGPRRGPLPRRLLQAQAAGRRALPPGHPAGVRGLRRGRSAGRARRRGRARTSQRLEELARANGSPWARAMADRSRALVDDDPEPPLRAAIATLEPTDIDVERGRSHLLYGEWLRRRKRRRDAREQLHAALDLFERSAAPAFVERARTELTATGLKAESTAAAAGPGPDAAGAHRRPARRVRAAPTPRSARRCSSAPTRSTTTCARSSRSSASPRGASSPTGSTARADGRGPTRTFQERGRGERAGGIPRRGAASGVGQTTRHTWSTTRRRAPRLGGPARPEEARMPFVTADDGAQIFYKDWGSGGSPVILSHGWPLNADAWDAGARFLAEHGHRVIAHDRRGHGRSTQTWNGNEMDTYADDLATLIEALDLDRPHPRRALHGRRRDRPLRRPARQRAGREARSRVGCSAAHAADRRQPRGPADRGLRRDPGRRGGRPLPAVPRPRGRPLLRAQPQQRRRPGLPRRLLAAGDGLRAPRGATSASRRSRPPTSGPTWPRSTCPRSSSTGTTTRSSRSRSAASGPPSSSPGAVLTVYEGSGHALPDTDRDRLHADLLEFINS